MPAFLATRLIYPCANYDEHHFTLKHLFITHRYGTFNGNPNSGDNLMVTE